MRVKPVDKPLVRSLLRLLTKAVVFMVVSFCLSNLPICARQAQGHNAANSCQSLPDLAELIRRRKSFQGSFRVQSRAPRSDHGLVGKALISTALPLPTTTLPEMRALRSGRRSGWAEPARPPPRSLPKVR